MSGNCFCDVSLQRRDVLCDTSCYFWFRPANQDLLRLKSLLLETVSNRSLYAIQYFGCTETKKSKFSSLERIERLFNRSPCLSLPIPTNASDDDCCICM